MENKVVLLNTLKFVDKVFVGVTKNSSVAVQDRSVRFRVYSSVSFVQRFLPRGCQVCVVGSTASPLQFTTPFLKKSHIFSEF